MFKTLVCIIQIYAVINAKEPLQQVGTSENSTVLNIDRENNENFIQRQFPYYFLREKDDDAVNKQKMDDKKYEHNEKADEADKIPKEVDKKMTRNTSFINIFVLSIIGTFFLLIVILLCLGSNSCVKRFFLGRQRIRKALQYRPSKYRSRVTPSPSCSDDNVGTPPNLIFQIA
jgi:hypothetical protein